MRIIEDSLAYKLERKNYDKIMEHIHDYWGLARKLYMADPASNANKAILVVIVDSWE